MTAVYVFGGLMAILVASVVIVPLVEQRRSGRIPTPRERRDLAIEALQELEFEYQTGKLALEDYEPLRARYAREAIAARDTMIAAGEDVGTPAVGAAASGACPDCGAAADSGGASKFCTICGASLRPAAGAAESA